MSTSTSHSHAVPREIDAAAKLALYRHMRLIRQCEEELARCHQRGLVHGACHTYVGQEAIAVGVCANLRTDDVVFSTHRGHGHALAKGASPTGLFAELFGRESGLSHGRGGSMHLFAPELGLMGTSGIVGPAILQAVGGGYSFRLLGVDGVAVAFFGDGAVNNGAFHEGLNLASIYKLPVLLVCENNQFATEVPFAYSSGNPSVADRGAAYGLPAQVVDGNDVLAVRAAAAQAVARARAGQGASLLECPTYRTRPHAEGMGDFTYRTREEVEAWKRRCPLVQLRDRLLATGEASVGDLAAIDADVDQQVAAARAEAEAAAWPQPASATRHLFAPPRARNHLARDEDSRPRPSTDAVDVVAEWTGETAPATWPQATLAALEQAMERDPRIFVLGEGIGVRGGNFQTTLGLFAKYGPLRLCDTPIAERGFVGLACGAAMTGTRPVVDFMFADFLLDAVGEVINQIAKMQYMSSGRLTMPIVLRGAIGVGHAAATHHSGSYYALFAQAPGLRVVVPSCAADAKGLLTHALCGDDPVLFLEHRELFGSKSAVPVGEYELPFGQARLVRRGSQATVVALARMVRETVAACEQLDAEGISVEVIDPRTVVPLDIETILASVRRTGRLLVVDEAPPACSFGADIAAQVAELAFDYLDAPVRRVHGAASPTPYSPPLEAVVVPHAADIAIALRALVEE